MKLVSQGVFMQGSERARKETATVLNVAPAFPGFFILLFRRTDWLEGSINTISLLSVFDVVFPDMTWVFLQRTTLSHVGPTRNMRKLLQ